MMNSDSQSFLSYSDDGSSPNRTGNFVVQPFNISGMQIIYQY